MKKTRRKLSDTEKMIRATRIARGRTTLGKIEKLQAQLKAARRRETLASAKVKEITDAITAEARWFASKHFTKELAEGKTERDMIAETEQ